MTDPVTHLPWTQKGWKDDVSAWIHAELNRLGISVSGPIEHPHERPWSSVLRIPSSSGDIYFKAVEASLWHEPALTEALWQWFPDCMAEVLAIDPTRGWMMTPDLGATLRSRIQSTADLFHWEQVLPLYAQVQIDLADRVDELMKLGILDRRLTELPTMYEQLLDDHDALRLGLPDGISEEEYRQLRLHAVKFGDMCQQLSQYRIPETIHHEDFHDANVYVQQERYTFADWGESGVSHPFCTLLVTWRVIAWRLELSESAPELERLRDIYLESWAGFETPENLVAAFKLAYRVGMICRALTWNRVLAGAPEPYKSEHADAVPGWLQEFLNPDAVPGE